MAFLFSFSLTSLSLLLLWEEQVQRCHHVSYTNKSNAILVIAWHVGKAVYCCAHAVQCRSASAVHVWGSALYITGVDVHGPRWCIGHASGSAMLLVSDNCMSPFHLKCATSEPEHVVANKRFVCTFFTCKKN